EDAVQDVFVVAHRRLADFRGDSRASTWLTSIAIKVARDHRRRHQRKATDPLPDAAAHLPDPAALPDERAALREAARRAMALIERLEVNQREVFVLSELEQFSAPEIAELTDTPLNTVYSRLRLARQAFSRLADEGGVS